MERVIVFVLIVSCEIVWVIFGWLLYVYFYFKSKKFNDIKKSIRENTKSCNELNEHIEELKNTYVEFARIDYGQADYIDRSRYNFKRP
ncbi:MAG: hypothetical protein LBL91_05090, partial [Lachnospiraceae bacterium]|nr:hypothetical protein [Lachnospiraceae bacterium]